MSQITTFLQPNGPGSGTVMSVTGGIGIVITGTPTVNPVVNIAGSVPDSFPTDSGTAVPSGNALTIHGAHGINTSGAGSTVTVAINNAITLGDLASIIGSPALTATTGDITLAAGNLNLPLNNSAETEGIITIGGIRYLTTESPDPLSLPGSVHLGYEAGPAGFPTIGCTSIGWQALTAISDPSLAIENTAVGGQCLWKLTTSPGNTAVGFESLASLTSGLGDNTVIGNGAGVSLLTGESNILIGAAAGGAYNGAETANIAIFDQGVSGENATIRIGENTTQTRCFIVGIVGVSITTPQMVVINSSNQLGSVPAGTASVSYTGVNHAASPYTALSTDYYISADVTGGVISILLPNAPTTGRIFIVKDKVGLAATSNITVTTVGGAVTIDGATTFVMNTAFESGQFIFNGTSYEVF